MKKIKVLIADDNTAFCDMLVEYLQQFEDIEIIGIANNDDDELKLIEEFKPDIVITDLMRNHVYSGLDIIKEYNLKKESPKFLVISADDPKCYKYEKVRFDGYIKKPFWNFSLVIEQLREIHKKI